MIVEAAEQRIVSQQQIAHLAGLAVGGGVAAFLRQRVAVAQAAVGVAECGAKRLHLGLLQREQLAFLADAVLIEIAPNAQ